MCDNEINIPGDNIDVIAFDMHAVKTPKIHF